MSSWAQNGDHLKTADHVRTSLRHVPWHLISMFMKEPTTEDESLFKTKELMANLSASLLMAITPAEIHGAEVTGTPGTEGDILPLSKTPLT
jgi:hypothetical protein